MKELEILSLYLPYNLKCGRPYRSSKGKMYLRTMLLKPNNISYASDWKPFLHPLSMLTEEIEREGKTTSLIEQLFKSLFPSNSFPCFRKHDVHFDPDAIVWCGHGIASEYRRMTFETIQFMVKHHIDFMRLIEQGKAIDKSKL